MSTRSTLASLHCCETCACCLSSLAVVVGSTLGVDGLTLPKQLSGMSTIFTQHYAHRSLGSRPSGPPVTAVLSRYPTVCWSARRKHTHTLPTRHSLGPTRSTPQQQPPVSGAAAGTKLRASDTGSEEGARFDIMPQEDNKAELEKLCNEYKSSKFPDCPEVRPRELWDRLAHPGGGASQEVLVVDVRRKEEQQVTCMRPLLLLI